MTNQGYNQPNHSERELPQEFVLRFEKISYALRQLETNPSVLFTLSKENKEKVSNQVRTLLAKEQLTVSASIPERIAPVIPIESAPSYGKNNASSSEDQAPNASTLLAQAQEGVNRAYGLEETIQNKLEEAS